MSLWGEIVRENDDDSKIFRENDDDDDGSKIFRESDVIDLIVKEKSSFFKSQQRTDPDLTTAEKIEIAEKLLRSNPNAFLDRYGQTLRGKKSALSYFTRTFPENEEIQYRVKELERELSKLKKNRRYKYLNDMLEDEYFSKEAMKSRYPLLYERFMGKNAFDKRNAFKDNDCRLSNMILGHSDLMEERELKRRQEAEEPEMESDSCDSEDEEEATYEDAYKDFCEVVYQKFLDGSDKGFDYSLVDDDPSLDDLQIMERDEEEKYFDS